MIIKQFFYISQPLIKIKLYIFGFFFLPFKHLSLISAFTVPRDKFLNSRNRIFVRWMRNIWKFHDWVCKLMQLVHLTICFSIYICRFRILDQFWLKKILIFMNWYFNERRIWIHFCKAFICIAAAELIKNRNMHFV